MKEIDAYYCIKKEPNIEIRKRMKSLLIDPSNDLRLCVIIKIVNTKLEIFE